MTYFSKQLIILALFFSLPVMAQDADEWSDDWGEDESSSPWNISSFIDVGVGGFTKDNITEKDESLLELRSQLNINRYIGDSFFSSKTELLLDDIAEDTVDLDIRELYIDHNLTSFWSLRVGEQVLTWGTGDFVFLNDFFPKNWQAMFSGRDDDYLKGSSLSIKNTFYTSLVNIDVVITPDFTGDTYITGERFSFFHPGLGDFVAAPPRAKVIQPKNDTEHAQYFMRVFNTHNGIEYAAYFYRGLYTQPLGFDPAIGRNQFPRLNSYGASVRSPILGGIGNIEIAQWNSIDDPDGNDPFTPNSQMQWLTGFEREAFRNLTMGIQYLLRKTIDYDEEKKNALTALYQLDEYQRLITLRVTHLALQQKLTTSLFIFYSPNDEDVFVKPKVSYRFDDNWLYVIGGNVFSGKKDHTQWAQFEKDTNIYARIKYSF